jgi:hypothetical protein
MQSLTLPSVSGGSVELDLCYPCQGLWLDPQENLKLTPAAVVELFRSLHQHRDDTRQPLAPKIDCPRCSRALTQGFDVVRSGRYVTYRCAKGHGRFSPFSSFMIEKGFVRLLTRAEIDDIAQRVAVIHCNSCGAPVDIRKDAVCPHCRSAFSLLDPQAVEQALQGYAAAARESTEIKLPVLADALVMMERDRVKAQREERARSGSLFSSDTPANVDLWAVGLALVWKMLE